MSAYHNISTGSSSGLPKSFNYSSSSFGSPPASQDGTGFQGSLPHSAGGGNNSAIFHVPAAFRVTQTEDYGPQINFTIWLLGALSAAFLALRVYCKFLRHRGLWWDDHVLIASWLSLATANIFVSVAVNNGFGRPLSEFNFKNLNFFLLIINLAGTFSILAALWSKMSFAITVLRISSGWTKALVWFIIITVNISLGIAVAFTWCQCTPIAKTWQPNLKGECWPKYIQIRYNIFTAIYSGAMDIVLALVPWKLIWTLTMNKKEKFGVMVAMSMGVFAGITSFIKITQLPSIAQSSFTESTTQLTILATAESAITIMAASIPILRALLRDTRPPPGSARFYHNMDINLMYAGSMNSRGTGRSSTVIYSDSGYTGSRSMSMTQWSKEEKVEPVGPLMRLSRLSRLSGLSMGFGGNSGRNSSHQRYGSGSGHGHTRGDSDTISKGPPPPPGKIVQTEEVVVEYEPQARPQSTTNQWLGIGRAI
ncbi:hypothetical protein QBC46DRAFT_295108 [Diplogelasinospora grovesii]|uniref:Rhodopsin domain-containing protein n=1 Tax=Diplogelasinospora grovesii TaxID=303347 RepID=A0AAN6S1H9_9PEZI|nr:hypothetical protein QBC46DRAFT_295108 [Diplogelasinospora grovesii]